MRPDQGSCLPAPTPEAGNPSRRSRKAALRAYEDKVLRLVAEHGGRVLERGTVLPGSQNDGEPPTEVQFLEMPSEASLDASHSA